jgi:hypothetical protein
MTHVPYTYKRAHSERYIFTSVGKKKIEKIVDFAPIDLIKVLATVIGILKDYTAEYPQVEVFFAGSTIERTKLYTRILKTYYATFSKEFIISAISGSENANKRIPFDPIANIEYLGFLIKRFN